MMALPFYFIFKNRSQRLTFELASVSAELIERMKPAGDKK
jgi:hypothetical protein